MPSRIYKKSFRPYEKQIIIDQENHWYLVKIRQNYSDIYYHLIEQKQLYIEQIELYSDVLTIQEITSIHERIRQLDSQIPTIGARIYHYIKELRIEKQNWENRTLYLA